MFPRWGWGGGIYSVDQESIIYIEGSYYFHLMFSYTVDVHVDVLWK